MASSTSPMNSAPEVPGEQHSEASPGKRIPGTKEGFDDTCKHFPVALESLSLSGDVREARELFDIAMIKFLKSTPHSETKNADKDEDPQYHEALLLLHRLVIQVKELSKRLENNYKKQKQWMTQHEKEDQERKGKQQPRMFRGFLNAEMTVLCWLAEASKQLGNEIKAFDNLRDQYAPINPVGVPRLEDGASVAGTEDN
ncbi:hypothetical protein H2200_005842 [Cladophialophora chaetospira]|uniref:Uncharacterized protein n=1 Tax=Cladophialophora chaetospira TaxID=386627 RepID=A0AA38X9Z6_9EURO|nr:hypothetical protein H2200_005842 [Cladophialophora chaetospira]